MVYTDKSQRINAKLKLNCNSHNTQQYTVSYKTGGNCIPPVSHNLFNFRMTLSYTLVLTACSVSISSGGKIHPWLFLNFQCFTTNSKYRAALSSTASESLSQALAISA